MQMIHDALREERLASMERFMQREETTSEQKAEALDGRLRRMEDARAEADERNRFERRRTAAMERAR